MLEFDVVLWVLMIRASALSIKWLLHSLIQIVIICSFYGNCVKDADFPAQKEPRRSFHGSLLLEVFTMK